MKLVKCAEGRGMPALLAPNPQAVSANPFWASTAGGSCKTCLYWLSSHGCCRSDSANFRILVQVESCMDWKRATAGAAIPNVTFSKAPWK
ncbi:hypothetical protein [Nibricoccus sp. IMCC34717]|uniref:hypothetical protein n=1 Tax=Nibricoccus sp. IMCC34717 TaxID=3034021 RepID=UPI00384DA51C